MPSVETVITLQCTLPDKKTTGDERTIRKPRRGQLRLEVQELQGQTTIGSIDSIWLLMVPQRESSATIKAAPAKYEQTSPAKAKNLIEIDCRGLEFTDFRPDGEWEATGIDSGTKFTGIDLSEGEWFDYDEKAGEEVSIKDIKWEVRRA
ncbi:hypothetical protein LTR67_002385 [Exophiala xenobiotica]